MFRFGHFLLLFLGFLLSLCPLSVLSHTYSERNRPSIDVSYYPLEHLTPVIGNYFSGNVTSDKLTCFGNRDVEECSYMHTLLCMVPGMRLVGGKYMQCDSLWGSRSVVVQVQGNVEFLQLRDLPEESGKTKRHGKSIYKDIEQYAMESILGAMPLTATRWLEIQSVRKSDRTWKKEIKHIPSEPFYLCARSNDWQGGDSRLKVEFRPTYFREQDFTWVTKKTIVHICLVVAVSSLWLMPYIAALVTCITTYIFGFDYYLFCMVLSGLVVCLTPLMLTRKNRHLAKLYLRYFFQRKQQREVKQLMRERLPLFQALYFSCAAMCIGCLGAFSLYSYFGIDREFRNSLYKGTMALSASWLAFFLCRTFERFFRKWSWVLMTLVLTRLNELHLNPQSQDEALVAILFITFAAESLLVPNIDLNARLGRDLRGVFWLEEEMMQMTRSTGLGGLLSPKASVRRGGQMSRRRTSKDDWNNVNSVNDNEITDFFAMSSENGDDDEYEYGEEDEGDDRSEQSSFFDTPDRNFGTASSEADSTSNGSNGDSIEGGSGSGSGSGTHIPRHLQGLEKHPNARGGSGQKDKRRMAPVVNVTINLTVNRGNGGGDGVGGNRHEEALVIQVEEAVRKAVGSLSLDPEEE